MNSRFLLSLLAATLAGCSGLDITTLSPDDEARSHAGGPKLSGYIIYAPMVVVEVSQKETCSVPEVKGKCAGDITVTCSAGAPFVLPDTSKPFLVNSRSGFGKAGVDVTINNGWQLGAIKDSSDNTALLTTFEKILSLGAARMAVREGPAGNCKAPGLYRVNLDAAGISLARLLEY